MRALACLILACLIAACVGAPMTAPASPTGASTPTLVPPTPTPIPRVKVLRIGHTRAPDVLDPARAATSAELATLRLVYEGLLAFDARGNIVPASADRWELAKDGMAMTFHLREGLARADGTALTAKDFELALRRALDPRLGYRHYASALRDLKGALELDALDPTKTNAEQIAKSLANIGVQATDDRTLVVTFRKPTGYWQFVAATALTFPADSQRIERDPDFWWGKPEGHNGNGAFVFRSIEPNRRIVFAPNANYWRGKPKLERIEFLYYADASAALDAYARGEVDLLAGIAPETLPAIAANAALNADLRRYPAARVYALGFNAARQPFDDKNVRVAFSQAFDRAGWVREVMRGVGKPYTRWIPPGVPGASAETPGAPAFDPTAAALTLMNGGYAAKTATGNIQVDCAKLGEIKLTFLNSPANQTAYQFLANHLAGVLGCPVLLEPVEPTAFVAASRDAKTRPQIFIASYQQNYPHPREWLTGLWTCGSELAIRLGYCNRDLDTRLEQADRATDAFSAAQLYQQAEDLLLADAPAAFANYGENLYLVKPYVRGLQEHLASGDVYWAGEWGPLWLYDIDLARVPANYPQQ